MVPTPTGVAMRKFALPWIKWFQIILYLHIRHLSLHLQNKSFTFVLIFEEKTSIKVKLSVHPSQQQEDTSLDELGCSRMTDLILRTAYC